MIYILIYILYQTFKLNYYIMMLPNFYLVEEKNEKENYRYCSLYAVDDNFSACHGSYRYK